MKRYGPAFVVSLILHLGLLVLAYISWSVAPKPIPVTSVAVEIVADAPSREMAETPVDELAVNQPEPIPAPEEVVTPPEPVPAPKLPVPEPQKPAAKAPEKKPDPPKKKTTPPDPKGQKKPQPDKKAVPGAQKDCGGFLECLAAQPATSPTKKPARANTQATDGQSQRGNAPNDAGVKTDLANLTKRLGRLWTLNCDVPGVRTVKIDLRFTLSPNGRIVRGPEWANRRADPVWEANANLAIAAVRKGEPHTSMDAGIYNKPLLITFDAAEVCRGR